MVIEELRLRSYSLERQYQLFADQLGIAVEAQTADRVTFRVGHSRLLFERAQRQSDVYHYALGLPGHRFADAVTWLAARVPLLTNQAGQREWSFDTWNAHGVYFADGDGNIAELIAHHTVESRSSGAFSGHSLLGVSEVGLVVEQVGMTVGLLEQQYGLQPYLGLSHPEFTAVGDAHGMFIVVARGRPWLPTGAPAQPTGSTTTFQVDRRRFSFSAS